MKRAIVKSVVIAIAIMLISVSAFAADVSASVVMDGDLWGTNGFVLGNQKQKDADLIQISISDAQFGASFRVWAPLANNQIDPAAVDPNNAEGGFVQLRKVNLWLKPIDMLKISIGNVSAGLFTEQLNWWMVPTGASAGAFQGWSPRWQSSAVFAETAGLLIELTPIEGLWIAAGIGPNYANAFMVDTDPVEDGNQLGVGGNTKFGVVAKYKIGSIGSVGVSYNYNGGTTAGDDVFANWQNIRAGMDFTMVPGLYAFLQGVLMLEREDPSATDVSLAGVTIDNYVAYTAGAFTVKAEFPFTLRLWDAEDAMPAYMTFDVKASYSLGAVSPFIRVRQNGDKNNGPAMVVFYDETPDGVNIFSPAIDLGADMTLGKAAIMAAIRVKMAPLEDDDIVWSIPFNVRVSW